jgi:multidrug efflux system membrane fusion protein
MSLFCAACGAKGGAAREKVVTPVRMRTVEEQSQLAGARYSGNTEPGTRVDLAFKVGGYVREIASAKGHGNETRKLQEGDWVKKGTVLAVVRESDYEIDLKLVRWDESPAAAV